MFYSELLLAPRTDFPANSNDSFCSSEISLDGSSSFGQIDEATTDTFQTIGLDHQGHSHHRNTSNGNGSFAGQGGVNPNPIDKLYLMQDSYFSGE